MKMKIIVSLLLFFTIYMESFFCITFLDSIKSDPQLSEFVTFYENRKFNPINESIEKIAVFVPINGNGLANELLTESNMGQFFVSLTHTDPTTGTSLTCQTIDELSKQKFFFLQNEANNEFLNGIQIIKKDISFDKGVYHIVKYPMKHLIQEYKTIRQYFRAIGADLFFTMLRKVVHSRLPANNDLIFNIWKGDSDYSLKNPITIFVPTNFKAATSENTIKDISLGSRHVMYQSMFLYDSENKIFNTSLVCLPTFVNVPECQQFTFKGIITKARTNNYFYSVAGQTAAIDFAKSNKYLRIEKTHFIIHFVNDTFNKDPQDTVTVLKNRCPEYVRFLHDKAQLTESQINVLGNIIALSPSGMAKLIKQSDDFRVKYVADYVKKYFFSNTQTWHSALKKVSFGDDIKPETFIELTTNQGKSLVKTSVGDNLSASGTLINVVDDIFFDPQETLATFIRTFSGGNYSTFLDVLKSDFIKLDAVEGFLTVFGPSNAAIEAFRAQNGNVQDLQKALAKHTIINTIDITSFNTREPYGLPTANYKETEKDFIGLQIVEKNSKAQLMLTPDDRTPQVFTFENNGYKTANGIFFPVDFILS